MLCGGNTDRRIQKRPFLPADGDLRRDEPAIEVCGVQSASGVPIVRKDVGVADGGGVGGEELQEVGRGEDEGTVGSRWQVGDDG